MFSLSGGESHHVSHLSDNTLHCPDIHDVPLSHSPQSGPHASVAHFGTHCPLPSQFSSSLHVPHRAPHPSLPQSFPAQSGVQAVSQLPETQVPLEQMPQEPPQPSAPHCLPAQFGIQLVVHIPDEQVSLPPHAPQVPPHPSGPHSFPSQLLVHASGSSTHSPAPTHVLPEPQEPAASHSPSSSQRSR